MNSRSNVQSEDHVFYSDCIESQSGVGSVDSHHNHISYIIIGGLRA